MNITTHTVLHNLIFGCLLVFLIQWIFLGNLRSAIIVGVNIPFALFFAVIIMVLMGQDANLLSVGAVDFGIIVDSAVILVENIFRNFQASPQARQSLLQQLSEGRFGADPTRSVEGGWTDRLRMILASALQVHGTRFLDAKILRNPTIPNRFEVGSGLDYQAIASFYRWPRVEADALTMTDDERAFSEPIPLDERSTGIIVVRSITMKPENRWPSRPFPPPRPMKRSASFLNATAAPFFSMRCARVASGISRRHGRSLGWKIASLRSDRCGERVFVLGLRHWDFAASRWDQHFTTNDAKEIPGTAGVSGPTWDANDVAPIRVFVGTKPP